MALVSVLFEEVKILVGGYFSLPKYLFLHKPNINLTNKKLVVLNTL